MKTKALHLTGGGWRHAIPSQCFPKLPSSTPPSCTVSKGSWLRCWQCNLCSFVDKLRAPYRWSPYGDPALSMELFSRGIHCVVELCGQGIRIEERAPEADQLLGKVLTHLEKDKPFINLDQEADAEYCEKFALGVFRNAERKDRAGQATRDTAKAYYAASIFLEIVKQFGELTEELEQYRRYAIFRATEIKKSLDRGEDAAPPPPPQAKAQEFAKVEKLPHPVHEGTKLPKLSGPLQMDPGYLRGTKIFYSDDEMAVKAKGVVVSKLEEDGNTFAVKIPGHGTVQAKLEQLAPDLEEGTKVLYAPEPGAPKVEAMLIQVECTNIWPPMYVVASLDGEQHACASRCLTLINKEAKDSPMEHQTSPDPIPPPPNGQTDARPAGSVPQAPPSTQPPEPEAPRPAVTSTRPAATAAAAAAAATAAAAQGAVHPSTGPTPTQQPPAVGPPPYSAGPAPPANPHTHQQPVSQAAAQQTKLANVGPPVPAPGFVPGLQAIESAKKYAKFAASSLGFDDVEAAVEYLNMALRLLTQPAEQK
eukprot:evm.model.scf_2097.3 EVM.evm.TU.scf_2097.3   scf_2097:20497-25081(-)